MYTQTQFFIDGKWNEAEGKTLVTTLDPATEEIAGTFIDGTKADIDHAVAAARRAFDFGPWPRMTHAERAEIMMKAAANLRKLNDEMAFTLTAEMGSPISQSLGAQMPVTVDLFEYYAGLASSYDWESRRPTYDAGNAGHDIIVRHEPVGVVAAIVPWNGPQIVAAMKLAPALLAGCTTILKPAPEATLNFVQFANAFRDAGLPDGVLNIVPAGREVGEYLVTHDGVDKVTFTGSTAVGRRLGSLCGERIRRFSLELGGKSAAILLPDVDVESAVESLIAPMMFISGQSCNAQTRILAPRSRYEEIIDAMATKINAVPYGDSRDPNTFVGPLASSRQRDRVEGYLELGKKEGANVVIGGGRPKDRDKGWYVEKTIFRDVDNSMRIAQEEIFGPVYVVIPYDGTEDAIAIANDSEYGLAGSIWTKDEAAGVDVARQIRAGSMGVNFYSLDCAAPFGGFKNSGIGRERGPEALASYLETKSILVKAKS
jgi:aldehyde dehydrogenase (NAD+)